MSVAHEIPLPELMEQGTDLIITWGSNRYIGREIASSSGQSHMHFSHVWPIPSGVATHLRRFRRRIVVENNTTNQFAKLLFRETGVHIDIVYGHDSGRPIDPAEVIKKMQT
jgi:2-oxoglutarate ferredoxin oxidoreductase subunit alpha